MAQKISTLSLVEQSIISLDSSIYRLFDCGGWLVKLHCWVACQKVFFCLQNKNESNVFPLELPNNCSSVVY